MSELTDSIIASFTIVLAFATIALVAATVILAKNTGLLAKITKQTSEASESRKIMPKLVFNMLALEQSGKLRFSVKNIGYGPALNPNIKIRLNGKEVASTAVLPTNVITAPEGLYYWDIEGAKMGDKVDYEVSFTNVNKIEMESFKDSFMVRQLT